MNGPKMAAFLITLASNVSFMNLINEVGAVRLPFLKQRVHMYTPMGFAGFEYGFPIGYEASLSRFKVQGNFLLLCWLCSSTNFVYSNHVGVMQWAHNSSAAAISHQVSDLRMWSCENVNYTTWGPGCVSSTCGISRRLFNIWYCRISSWHHDTSIGLTNSTEIPWCAVLFWKNLERTLRSESSIQSFVQSAGWSPTRSLTWQPHLSRGPQQPTTWKTNCDAQLHHSDGSSAPAW